MNGQSLRKFVIAAIVLVAVAAVWFLPRALSFGASTPPASIELRSDPAPTISPTATAAPRAVDERGDDEDDGGDDQDPEPRTNRESVPDTTRTGDDDDAGDGDDDDGDDGDDDDDDDLGDDDGDDD